MTVLSRARKLVKDLPEDRRNTLEAEQFIAAAKQFQAWPTAALSKELSRLKELLLEDQSQEQGDAVDGLRSNVVDLFKPAAGGG